MTGLSRGDTRSRRGGVGNYRRLWLFTDAARMPDVVAAVGALPAGLCGVVFRHDGVPARAALLRAVAAVCRQRRLALVVAGGGALPVGAGRHLRDGRGVGPRGRLSTGSAHDRAGIVRNLRAGVAIVFLSPVFPTASHPGAATLGPTRWRAIAGRNSGVVGALGGLSGRSVKRLGPAVAVVGAIENLTR